MTDLFPKWSGVLELPALPERRIKIGEKFVIQKAFAGAAAKGIVRRSQYEGHDLISFDLLPPFHEILLRHKGKRRIETSLPVVTTPDLEDIENPGGPFTLQWDTLGLLAEYADSPEKVLKSWTNKFAFRTEDEEEGSPGLRLPQVGALHAISAHFAVGANADPATIVLPTGTGKTETMLATQIYRRLHRTLVIVPSDALRKQIAGKFITLGVLPLATVVPHEIAGPRVAIIDSGIKSVEEAKKLIESSNVLVALPASLASSTTEVLQYLTSACSDLIVDEAHHITAPTWQTIREQFEGKRILQFTATPFRRDGERIDGKIIFNYKLGDAQAAGYYRPINLRTVEEYGDLKARDRAIAQEAVAALKRDREELGLDHLIMARAWPTTRADEILEIYEEIAPEYKPVKVYSGTGRKTANQEALDALYDRGPNGSRIVVCVDMLGEGVDLPNLKIAALHDLHKSLAITLQFIGRFTRKGKKEEIGEATAVVNIADPDVELKLADLYSEGADWDQIIKRLSEERIEQELRLQDVIYGLKQEGDLHAQVSLWNLRPTLSAQFYKTSCLDWSPLKFASVLPKGSEHWYSYSEADKVLVAVVCRPGEVNWGRFQNVVDTIYDLVILRWDQESKVLCLFSSDYNALRSEKMAEVVCAGSAELVAGRPVFRVLNNVQLPLAKQLGASRIGAISFTSYFGPNVTEGLASIEKAESALNNIACLGYENGEKVLWGVTARRGKIWQQKSGTVSDWIRWTDSTWQKLTDEDNEVTNVTEDFLRPKRLERPHDSHPISVQWGEQAQMRFNDRQFVLFGEHEVPVFAIDLELRNIAPSGAIDIAVHSAIATSEYRLTIDSEISGGYKHEHISGLPLKFKAGKGGMIPFDEYLMKDPFIIRYVDGTYSYNCFHIPVQLEASMFEKSKLESWDWTGIELNKESMHKSRDKDTIQYRTYEMLEAEFDVIFNDDGCGEAADLVCLKDLDHETIQFTLVHCKGAHEGRISQDIRNFYTVCGQAQKSVAVKHSGIPTLYHDLKRREAIWIRENTSRFLKGNMSNLAFFKEKARKASVRFEMILVQPGASIATVTDDALRLLATTELYLQKTTQAIVRIVLSQ